MSPRLSRIRTIQRISTEPPWSSRARLSDELIIRGCSADGPWGFGQHPATSLCLSILIGLFGERGPRPKRVVELNCGAGVLSVAAACLGATEVIGVEPDASLRALAGENARANRDGQSSLRICESLAELALLERARRGSASAAPRFELALANLPAPALHAAAEDLARLGEGAHLLLAGFLEEEREALEQRFLALGFRFLYREAREGFLASVFKSRAS